MEEKNNAATERNAAQELIENAAVDTAEPAVR